MDAGLMSRMSFPPELRNPCKVGPKRKLDVDLIVSFITSASDSSVC